MKFLLSARNVLDGLSLAESLFEYILLVLAEKWSEWRVNFPAAARLRADCSGKGAPPASAAAARLRASEKTSCESALRILHCSHSQTLSPIPHSLATSGPTALFGSEIQNILLQWKNLLLILALQIIRRRTNEFQFHLLLARWLMHGCPPSTQSRWGRPASSLGRNAAAEKALAEAQATVSRILRFFSDNVFFQFSPLLHQIQTQWQHLQWLL